MKTEIFRSVLFMLCQLACNVLLVSLIFLTGLFAVNLHWGTVGFGAITFFIFVAFTCWNISWSTIPSWTWRFRKNLEIRTIELMDEDGNQRYFIQVKVFGLWYYVLMDDDNDAILSLTQKFSMYDFDMPKKRIESNLKKLDAYLQDPFVGTGEEVLGRLKYERGQGIK